MEDYTFRLTAGITAEGKAEIMMNDEPQIPEMVGIFMGMTVSLYHIFRKYPNLSHEDISSMILADCEIALEMAKVKEEGRK